MSRLRVLVAADRVGLLDEFIRSERTRQDASMWVAAADYVQERIEARTCSRTVWQGFRSAQRLEAREVA
jgi:hypothetical protein